MSRTWSVVVVVYRRCSLVVDEIMIGSALLGSFQRAAASSVVTVWTAEEAVGGEWAACCKGEVLEVEWELLWAFSLDISG